MDIHYTPQFPADEPQITQTFFGEQSQPQLQPQPQSQYQSSQQTALYCPFPTANSTDSGYAEENPFEDSVFRPEFKSFGTSSQLSNVDMNPINFGGYGFMANGQQPASSDQDFTSFSFYPPYQGSFDPTNQQMNISQSPPALIMDDVVSVKSEEAPSESASPRTITHDNQRNQQTHFAAGKRPDTLKRRATDTSIEGQAPPTTKEGRGRLRKRIPHTAVERRYRENLNSQLENLRAAVPKSKLELAVRRRPSDLNEPINPTKCEILVGAVKYIKSLEKKVAELERLGGLSEEMDE